MIRQTTRHNFQATTFSLRTTRWHSWWTTGRAMISRVKINIYTYHSGKGSTDSGNIRQSTAYIIVAINMLVGHYCAAKCMVGNIQLCLIGPQSEYSLPMLSAAVVYMYTSIYLISAGAEVHITLFSVEKTKHHVFADHALRKTCHRN